MSLRIGADGVALCLQDRENFHIRNHRQLEAPTKLGDPVTIAQIIEPLASMQTAQTVSCSFNTSGNTLVPTAIFQEDKTKEYLAFHVDVDQAGAVEADDLLLLEARNVYSLPESHRAVSRVFPQCRFFHESTIEVELALRLSRLNQEDAVYLFFSKDFFRLVFVRDNQLQLANTFAHASEMDVAYYVLYVFDQLGIAAGSTPTYATGEVDENSTEINMLREYIGPVRIMTDCKLADLNFDPESAGQAQRLFTLFHQVLCVS